MSLRTIPRPIRACLVALVAGVLTGCHWRGQLVGQRVLPGDAGGNLSVGCRVDQVSFGSVSAYAEVWDRSQGREGRHRVSEALDLLDECRELTTHIVAAHRNGESILAEVETASFGRRRIRLPLADPRLAGIAAFCVTTPAAEAPGCHALWS